MKERFILPHAPKSKEGEPQTICHTGMYLLDGKNTEMPLELVDGEYIVDEPDLGKRRMIVASLVRAGFKPAGVIEEKEPTGGPPAGGETGSKAPTTIEERIRLMHPDNTPGNVIDGVEVTAGHKKVKVEAGIVETEDLKVVAALVKKGFIVQNPHALERAEEKRRASE